MNTLARVASVLFTLAFVASVSAQNPIQWSGNARSSIERARELSLPLMFWVDQRSDNLDEDDLRDAQEQAFRDPIVAWLAQQRFVPVRVSRNSRVLEEARQLGLPTEFGLYIAVVTAEGKVLDRIDPGDAASPETLAGRLAEDSRRYRNSLYDENFKSVITNPEAPKEQVRRAVQAVWRLGIFAADGDVVALLGRPDLTQTERARLYAMLASIATKPCIDALLERAEKGEREAAAALGRAEAGALEWLLPELPPSDAAEISERQNAAYAALTQIARAGVPRPPAFWKNAKPQDRARELDRVRSKAEAVLDHWKETVGRWR